MRITASTPLFALLGNPTRQSLSPILHNGWIEEHGFDGAYVALCSPVEQFETALSGLFQAGLQGANITSPFKERAAVQATQLTASAFACQSVNCLTPSADGLIGDSTDGRGLLADLDARAKHWRQMSGHIVILGAGGAARDLLHALYQAGFTKIDVVNRNFERAKTMIENLNTESVRARTWTDMADSLSGASLIINASKAGFGGLDDFAPDFSKTLPDALVYDMVYAPQQTLFLSTAQANKRMTLGGLGMLVGQGALAFENWFGVRPDLLTGLSRLEAELKL